MTQVVITAAKRTAVGSFLGAFATTPAPPALATTASRGTQSTGAPFCLATTT